MPTPRLRLAVLALSLAGCGRETAPDHDRAATAAASTALAAPEPMPTPPSPPGAPLDASGGGVALVTAERSVPTAAASPAPSSLAATSAEPASAMLIRTGRAAVRVDSLATGIARVRELARRSGALVANTSVAAGRDEHRSATLELRVPGERFDEVVGALGTVGALESVQVAVQDVGEEFTDVSARVANAKRLEARLLELAATRTGRLADVLAVERELARVREEVERHEGRLRWLRTRASYSTLSVTVHERAPLVAPGPHPIAEALREAWRRFVWLVAALIAALGVLVPVAGLAAGAWVLVRRRFA